MDDIFTVKSKLDTFTAENSVTQLNFDVLNYQNYINFLLKQMVMNNMLILFVSVLINGLLISWHIRVGPVLEIMVSRKDSKTLTNALLIVITAFSLVYPLYKLFITLDDKGKDLPANLEIYSEKG